LLQIEANLAIADLAGDIGLGHAFPQHIGSRQVVALARPISSRLDFPLDWKGISPVLQ